MGRHMFHAAGALMLAAAFPAAAAEAFVSGVYMRSPELCASAKKNGIESVLEEGNVLLTDRGFESYEYNCEFLNVTPATRAPGWVVTALCQEPGYAFPDVLSVIRMNDTQIDIATVRATTEEDPGNSGSYYLCEGVAMP
ncbi:MAG: hypothetical protein M9939_24610 [Mesorhizobium sp.]|nr:hypothetical protein [Mesorhizobium sp.]MCO5164274.1 hypothetical protein [Mesorhizobium sp.]